MACDPILKITDGTTTINLLSAKGVFLLKEWNQALAQEKASAWQSSDFNRGRSLLFKTTDNIIDTLVLSVRAPNQDSLIRNLRELYQLLDKAVTYWTTKWQTEPVWIVARAQEETNTRYAVIKDYKIPEDVAGMYAQPFFSKTPAVSDLSVTIEHDMWTDTEPLTSTCVELSEGGYHSSGAYEFDGSSTSISCGSGATIDDLPSGDFTAEFWFRADGWGEGNAGVILWKNHFIVSLDETNSAINVYIDRVTDIDLDIPFTPDSEWHHCAVVFDITTVTADVYIDGIYIDNDTGAGAYVTDASDTLYIGNNSGGTATFDGAIGWTRLSDTERYSADFTPQGRCFPPELDSNTVAQYHFSEGTSTTLRDFTDNGNTGTITAGDGGWSSADCLAFNTDTCEREVFLTNHHKMTQLTHIFVDDGGAFGENLVTADTPFNLLPAVPAVGDAIYFGVASASQPTGPFSSLVFDIGTAQVDVTTIYWQYWDGTGAAWANITDIRDNTNAAGLMTGDAFDTTGVNVVSWNLHEICVENTGHLWGTTAVNGVTGWWVRAYVNAIGTPSAPTQQNRPIYTISWPYVEIDSEQVGGDIEALARYVINSHHYEGEISDAILGSYWPMPQRVFLGTRSNSRGEDFTAYLNISDVQNPPGITVTASGYGSSFVNAPEAPTRRAISYTPALTTDSVVAITIGNSVADQYYGTYRVFLRYRVLAGGALNGQSFYITIRDAMTYAAYYTTKTSAVQVRYYELADLGIINIPLNDKTYRDGGASEQPYDFDIIVYSTGTALPTTTTLLYDLVLMPIDEWSGEFDARYQDVTGDVLSNFVILDIDSVTVPKIDLRAISKWNELSTNTGYRSAWKTISSNPASLQANATQRLWMLSDQSTGYLTSHQRVFFQEYCYAIQAYKKQRYHTMRGAT